MLRWKSYTTYKEILPTPQLSVRAPALGSNCNHVADLHLSPQPAQLIQPNHLLMRKTVIGTFHFHQLKAMVLRVPHHQVREAPSAVPEVHSQAPAHPTKDRAPQAGNKILSLLKRSKALPADDGGHPAFLGLPGGCHPGPQALHRGTVNLLQPGLDGQRPALEEAVRAQVQRERLHTGKIHSHATAGEAGYSRTVNTHRIWKCQFE